MHMHSEPCVSAPRPRPAPTTTNNNRALSEYEYRRHGDSVKVFIIIQQPGVGGRAGGWVGYRAEAGGLPG